MKTKIMIIIAIVAITLVVLGLQSGKKATTEEDAVLVKSELELTIPAIGLKGADMGNYNIEGCDNFLRHRKTPKEVVDVWEYPEDMDLAADEIFLSVKDNLEDASLSLDQVKLTVFLHRQKFTAHSLLYFLIKYKEEYHVVTYFIGIDSPNMLFNILPSDTFNKPDHSFKAGGQDYTLYRSSREVSSSTVFFIMPHAE